MKKEAAKPVKQMVSGNTIRGYTAQEKAAYCQKWQQSKSRLTQSEFCKREGISTRSLGRWLSAGKKVQSMVKLLPVKAVSLEKSQAAVLITFPSGVVLTLPWRPDQQMAQWIKDLLS